MCHEFLSRTGASPVSRSKAYMVMPLSNMQHVARFHPCSFDCWNDPFTLFEKNLNEYLTLSILVRQTHNPQALLVEISSSFMDETSGASPEVAIILLKATMPGVVQLHLQPSYELPPHYHTTKNLPSHLVFTLLEAFQTAKSSFSDIITTLNPTWSYSISSNLGLPDLLSSQGIPAVHFAPLGAATMSYCYHHYVRRHPDGDFPFQELRFGDDNEKKSLDGLFQFMYYNVFEEDEDVVFVNYRLSTDIALLKTSRGLEGKYIDYVSAVANRKLLPVGPLVADVNKDDDDEEKYSDMMEWLSKKNQHSTVYISFGSEYFLSKPEIEEIAKGLELSDTNFIWVIRMLVEAGACVEVERDENGVYKGEEIAKAIRKVVVESSGEGLRQRAQE
ncbi:UDP-glucosyltransferase 29 [Sesamum angolense]|uniref:UDP-glucosyltransferase 29 n=1 Tax=Sesamum angolense TaxID=2727404 RepID=A0AAE1TAN8_9LAMI|nr:UDP-glucosyltransferase 29 [Sesamum angolense]